MGSEMCIRDSDSGGAMTTLDDSINEIQATNERWILPALLLDKAQCNSELGDDEIAAIQVHALKESEAQGARLMTDMARAI